MTLLTKREAQEAAMNGALVRERNYPPYLPCRSCGGDGSNQAPYDIGCKVDHESGWEVVAEREMARCCVTCGAVITEGTTEMHNQWHDSEAGLARVARDYRFAHPCSDPEHCEASQRLDVALAKGLTYGEREVVCGLLEWAQAELPEIDADLLASLRAKLESNSDA